VLYRGNRLHVWVFLYGWGFLSGGEGLNMWIMSGHARARLGERFAIVGTGNLNLVMELLTSSKEINPQKSGKEKVLFTFNGLKIIAVIDRQDKVVLTFSPTRATDIAFKMAGLTLETKVEKANSFYYYQDVAE
jgi:hypothetical protein